MISRVKSPPVACSQLQARQSKPENQVYRLSAGFNFDQGIPEQFVISLIINY
jgi:hypothetical protein